MRAHRLQARACGRCSSGSTAAPPSSMPRRPISTRPTRRRCSARPRTRPRFRDRRKVMILGGGPNRIGQGIEFDYCCCHAAFALGRDRDEARASRRSWSIATRRRCRTDPDTSDRLYFEPLTAEDVLEIVRARAGAGRAARGDRPTGRADAAQAGGRAAGGGGADPRHLARQHRSRRGPRAVRQAGRQAGAAAAAPTASRAAATRRSRWPSGSAIRCCCGRPTCSAGAAWRWSTGPQQLDHYIATAVRGVGHVAGADRPLSARRDRGRRRRDLRRRRTSRCAGVLQHIEEAGVHSGDSACAIPPHSLTRRRSSPRSSGRRASWRWRSRSRG